MTEFFSGSAFCSVFLTLVAFWIGSVCQKKGKSVLFNPILIATAIVIAVLTLLDIPNQVYQEGCRVLTFFLTPATVCLALSLYQQLKKLRPHLWAILAGVAAGSVASLGTVWALSRVLGLEEVLLRSLLPKSVTSAIGFALAEEIGGIGAIATASIIFTGILGNMFGCAMLKLFKIRGQIAQGVAFGTASHVIGTPRAAQLSPLTGAVSSLSLTVAGILTTIILSLVYQ